MRHPSFPFVLLAGLGLWSGLFIDLSQVAFLQDMPAKRVILRDFKQQKHFWTEQEAERMLHQGRLGRTPESAIVPLVFSPHGFLLTPLEYNRLRYSDTRWFYTDLATFYRVTGRSTARPEYAQVLTEHRGAALYAYDPYALHHQTRQEEALQMEALLQPKAPLKDDDFARLEEHSLGFEPGDILIRPNIPIWHLFGSTSTPPKTVGSGWGHAAGISRFSLPGADLDRSLADAWLIEAWGGEVDSMCQVRETRACVPGKSEDCDREPIENNNYWCKKRKGSRVRLRLDAPKEERDAIAEFWRQQDQEGDIYSPFAKKRFACTPTMLNAGCNQRKLSDCGSENWANGNRWYCSLLVWQAYWTAADVDIDVNGGAYVFPNDIIKSPVFQNTEHNREKRVRF